MVLVDCCNIFDFSKEVLKDIVKSGSGLLSKKDIYSYLSCESPGLRNDEFYMVYRAILNTSSSKNKSSKKRKDQIESVFTVMMYGKTMIYYLKGTYQELLCRLKFAKL